MNSKYIAILPAALAVSLTAAAADSEKADTTSGKDVHVAFRTVAQDDILGGVSVLDMEDLLKKNYINGTQSMNLEGYVAGYNGNSLWGMDSDGDNGGVLILVDGVPRDQNNVSPSEIAQISFLKGAQASVLYGSRGAKGAVLITTKRGHEGPLQVKVRANTGWHVAKSFPEYLGSAEYMTLYNEARANDGLDPLYSATDIYNYASGANPYRYPNLNFYSEKYVKKTYNFADATAEISGGNERARFYTNINYYRFGDLLNFGEGTKDYTDRFSARGNINLNLGAWVSAYVDAAATFYGARSAKGNFWSDAATMRPNRISPFIPLSMVNKDATLAQEALSGTTNIFDGMFLAGTSIDKTNSFADIMAGGYNKFTSRQFQFDTGINLNLNSVVKGLTFGAQFAVDYATTYNSGFTNTYATFVPTWTNQNGVDEIVSISQEGKDERSGSQYVSNSTDRQTIHFSGQFNYDRTFAGVHNVHATALANGWQRTFSGEYHRLSNANVGFQLDYNYDRRYYLTAGVAGIHSAKLAPGHRQAWSPSATIGWRLSEEGIIKLLGIFDDLMLSASASDIATDIYLEKYYMYTANYTRGGWFSWAPGGYKATYPERGANEDLTFTKRKEFSANLRGRMFNNLIEFDLSAFISKTTGLPFNKSTKFPSYFSTYYPEASLVPWLNYNDNERKGFDFGVKINKNFGDLDLSLGVNGTYYTTKATKRDEINEYAYLNREGKILDGIWGYECEGFFTTDEEAKSVDQSALGSSKLMQGDLKYKDQNGDGKIDSKDQVLLAKGGWYGAPFTLGVNFTAQWKGFTLFALGTGYFGGHGVKDNSYWWVKGDDKYSAAVRDRWNPNESVEYNLANAKYPRLTTTNGANNFVISDFWIYSTDRFNLAKVQLTYTFAPKTWVDKVVKGISIYVSGDNLLTCGKNKDILEMNIGSAPQTRFYNIGAQVTF